MTNMVERICPHCQGGNPLDHRFCGQCGASLDRSDRAALPGPESSGLMVTGAVPVRLKQIGQAMLVSLIALAAEAGMAWLRYRIETIRHAPDHPGPASTSRIPQSSSLRSGNPDAGAMPVQPFAGSGNNRVTVWSQRVIESWEQGELIRQTVDRQVWRWEKE